MGLGMSEPRDISRGFQGFQGCMNWKQFAQPTIWYQAGMGTLATVTNLEGSKFIPIRATN